ncbi:YciI family protein [Taibaiella soli]|uniref:YCII-related domain-containing protein n=1 Tax=Taibaiella soli TaxID=1649169 RepID=A0A2W2B8M8_9BACT|nr:YciI family protein [Taibaiella soli]PZF72317.1 hypothetical protein DN068_13245 [Taibaiella soli]
MKQEFMLHVRNVGNAKASFSEEKHLMFVKACELYIKQLKDAGQLVSAQPLMREGCIISKIADGWKQRNIEPDDEIQVGYYHILANNLNEAIEIARRNPEFEYVPSATIELRPIKMKEEQTGYIYPNQ